MTVPRVAVLIGAYPPSTGGAQAHTHQLARTLAQRGVVCPEVTTLWRETRTDWVAASTQPAEWIDGDDEAAPVPVEDLDGVPVMTIGLESSSRVDPWLRRSYYPMRRSAARHFADELQQPLHDPADGVDVVHAVRLGREHLALRGVDEARARDLPFVLTPNHHPRWSRRTFPDPVWRKLYRSADAVFALTQTERGMLTELGVEDDRIVVTGIGAVLTPTGSRPDALADDVEQFLLFLGQQYPYKRLDQAVAAFDLIARGDAELHLVVAGPQQPETEHAVGRSKFPDRVHVLGQVDEPAKRWLLDHAGALLFPSEQESFGGVVVEAATAGCPVVVAPVPAVAEVVDRLGWGVVAGSTAGSFAEAARALLIDPPEAAAREQAMTRATARYSWPALAEIYEHTYHRLLSP
jgi:glycosyltransferase involved in cell wall biosynthesis